MRDALGAEQATIDRITSADVPASAVAALEAALAVHQRHVTLLDEAATAAGVSPATPTETSSLTASPAPSSPQPDLATELMALASAEHGLVERHTDAAVDASSGHLARLLGGMAAAAAQQAAVLGRLARRLAAAEEGNS